LDEVLAEDCMEEMVKALGNVAFNQALDLRYYAQMRIVDENEPIKKVPRSATPVPGSSTQPSGLKRNLNVAKLIPDLDLGPWVAAQIPDQLPALPQVLDPTLAAGAFIHQGSTNGNVTDVSYERLEWIGDSYIYLLSSILISKTFPALPPGKCSQLRERLVKNVTLADYARQYGFDKRAKLPSSFSLGAFRQSKDADKTKVFGDIFEAYVAAVVLSDPEDGMALASVWLKDLWGMTIKKEIIKEEKNGLKIKSPLWSHQPVAAHGKPAELPSLPPNHKEKLQKLLGSKVVKIEYKDAAPVKKDKETKLPLFTVGVYLTGWGEKDKLLGTGTAHGKKEAGSKAAAMAMQNRKAMDMYVEKKRVYDAQQALEEQALADAES
jgi:ribonuclease-3